MNPTHYAVALRRRGEDGSIVLAKGVDHLAAKIRAEASRHNILIENRPVAVYMLWWMSVAASLEYFAPVTDLGSGLQRRAQRIKR